MTTFIFIWITLHLLLVTVSQAVDVYDTLDVIQILIDGNAHSITFNATRSTIDLQNEINAFGLKIKDQDVLLKMVHQRQQEQRELRKHAVPINTTYLNRVFNRTIQDLDCQVGYDNHLNFIGDGSDGGDGGDGGDCGDCGGQPAFLRMASHATNLLLEWEKNKNPVHKESIMASATCTMIFMAQIELNRLKKDAELNRTIMSSSYSYRWVAEPAQAVSILSRARQATEPSLHERERLNNLMDLAVDLLTAALSIQLDASLCYAAAIVERTRGHYVASADLYNLGAEIRFSPNQPIAGHMFVEQHQKRSPYVKGTELFEYLDSGDAGALPDSKRGTSAHVLHTARQLQYLIEIKEPLFDEHRDEWLQIASSLENDAQLLARNHGSTKNPSLTILHPLTNNYSKAVHGKLLHRFPADLVLTSDLFGDWNAQQLEQRFWSGHKGHESLLLATQDNFLSPKTLQNIQHFLWESTVFLFPKGKGDGGYIGAYLESGLASPLLLQIAETLKRNLPSVLSGMRLVQLWGYKYIGGKGISSGIGLHADEARININLWITPVDQNKIEGGGLEVFDKLAKTEMDFDQMNRDEEKIRTFLVDAKKITVPYQCNRATIFDSRLFHRTQNFQFPSTYKERRINLTFLFGER